MTDAVVSISVRMISFAALYLSPKLLNDLRILQIGFRERPLPPEAKELAR
jgi:hypothetical protein